MKLLRHRKLIIVYVHACTRPHAASLVNEPRGVSGAQHTSCSDTAEWPLSPCVAVYSLCRYVLHADRRVHMHACVQRVCLVLAGVRGTSLSRSAAWRASPSAVVYLSLW